MYLNSKSLALSVALLAGLSLAGLSRAEEVKKTPSPAELLKALAENGKPGPEHKKLEPLVGDWTFTLKLWTNPNEAPAEVRGDIERKWVLGGRFVQETVQGKCDGGKTFEGLGLLGYDNAQKKFTATRACGLCGKVCSSKGAVTDSDKKFEFATEEYCPLCRETVKGRDELIIEGKDKVILNVYKTVKGKEVKVIEVVSTRKK
jgi:hypothetical protein